MITYASGGAHITAAKTMVGKLQTAILFPLMMLMMSVAFLVFLWGVYEYVLGAADESARTTGRAHMLWGIIGFLVMISAYAILSLAASTFGVTVPS